MALKHQRNLIKHLQSDLPRGRPFDLATLKALGVSPQLAAYYVKEGWLVRVAHGVYAHPGDDFPWHGAVDLLQARAGELHVGGKSALAMNGVRHNLSGKEPLVLWGRSRFVLPSWFTGRYPARYVHANLFAWTNVHLEPQTLGTPPGAPDGVRASVPERAVLEMLYEVGTRVSLEEARNLFDGLRSPRKALLGELLSICTSVKAVRLFLAWARETGVLDVDALIAAYNLNAGSAQPWVSKLSDGTRLRLKQHG